MANAAHVKLLKQGIEFWNQWRSGNPKVIPDLSRAELNKTDLTGANLSRANLSSAYLCYASLRNADLRGADLRGASLSGTDLKDAQLNQETIIDKKWRFVWAIVSRGARGKDLRNIDLRGANLSGSDLRQTNLAGADLSETDLSNADLSQARLNEASLIGADLRQANLTDVDLKGANLNGADLNGANTCGTNLNEANLTGVLLQQIQLLDKPPNEVREDLPEPQAVEPVQGRAMHYLICEYDTGRQKVLLDRPNYVIGRDASCDIRLPSKFVSRRHARLVRLYRNDGSEYYQILDGAPDGKPSVNGLLINSRKLSSCDLQSGDEIVFGPRVRGIYYQQTQVSASGPLSDKEGLLSDAAAEEADERDKVTLRVSSELVQEVIDYLNAHQDPTATHMSNRLQKYVEPE